MRKNRVKIVLVAGEASGDTLGAGLIRELRKCNPKAEFFGIAGPRMQIEGCTAWHVADELSVIGIVEVIKHLPRIMRIRRALLKRIIELKPDIFIGIDSPDFNINLEGKLQRAGIPTVHYVSPSVWAWRHGRVRKLSSNTSLVLALFPFEKEFYDRLGIPCCFVGHPMADHIPMYPDKCSARINLGISPDSLCMAILPGSRLTEIEMLSADFLKAALILSSRFPNLKILVPLISNEHRIRFENIKKDISPTLSLTFLDRDSCLSAIIASDAAIAASGTVVLECLLAKCPVVVGYRLNAVTFWLAKKLVKVDYISLPNILSGSTLVQELIQDKCKPEMLAEALELMLSNGTERDKLLKSFYEIHKQIRCNADKKAKDAIMGIIHD